MNATWHRLLSLETQPSSLRICYELLESLLPALRLPAPSEVAHLRGDERRRLGYLIAASRLLAGVSVHESWLQLELSCASAPKPKSGLVLLAADDRTNQLDDLAKLWGFRNGLSSMKLAQIARFGAS